MTKNGAFHAGRAFGESAEPDLPEALAAWERAWESDGVTLFDFLMREGGESEAHARQFSPFEFLARDLNASRDPDGAWEAYEAGVEVGLRQVALAACRTYLAQVAERVGLPAPRRRK